MYVLLFISTYVLSFLPRSYDNKLVSGDCKICMVFVRVIVIVAYINIEEYIIYHFSRNLIIIVIINVRSSKNFDV